MHILEDNNMADMSITYSGTVYSCTGPESKVEDPIFIDGHRFCFVALKDEVEEKFDRVPKVLALPILKRYAQFAMDKSKFKLHNENLKEEDITAASIQRYDPESIDISIQVGDEYCVVRLGQCNTFMHLRNTNYAEFSRNYDIEKKEA